MLNLEELQEKFCPPLEFSLVENMFNERNDDDECICTLMVLADNVESINAETDDDDDSVNSEETNHFFGTRSNGKAIANGEVNVEETYITLNGNEVFIGHDLSVANSSVENLEGNFHRLGISEGSDSGCSMSTTSEEMAPNEETERLEISKEEKDNESMFLKDCFPDICSEKLEELLRKYCVEGALEILLAEIDQREIDQQEFPVIALTPSKGKDKLDVESRAQHRKKKRKKQRQRAPQKNANVHELSSTRSKSPVSPSSSYSSSSSVFSPAHDRLRRLKSIFPEIPEATVSHVFHANNRNVLETAKELYNDAPVGFAVKQEQFDKDLAELISNFYDHDVDLLQKILVITRGELEKAIDLMLLIDDDTKNGSRTWSQIAGSSTSPSKSSNIREIWVREDDWKQNASSGKVISASQAYDRDKSRSRRLYDDDEEKRYNDDDEEDYDDGSDDGRINDPVYCRKKAEEYRRKRDEVFRHAADVYKKTRYRKRNEVYGYPDQGRAYDAKMKEWNLLAAKAQVRQKSKARGNPNFVDLHGLTVNEALAVVKEELKRWSSTPMRPASNKKPLEIITGAGNHSHNNVPKLWLEVTDYLEEANWEFKKDRGSFVVRGRKESS